MSKIVGNIVGAQLSSNSGGGGSPGEQNTYSLTIRTLNACSIAETVVPTWYNGKLMYEVGYASAGEFTHDSVAVGYPVIFMITCRWDAFVSSSAGLDFIQNNHMDNMEFIIMNTSGAESATITIDESD